MRNFTTRQANDSTTAPISARPAPPRAPASPLHQLRGALGNQALGHVIQAKLQISQPGDAYEQEADRLAEHVMQAPDAAPADPRAGGAPPPVSQLQRKCAQCEDEEMLQAKESPGQTPRAAPETQSRIDGLQGGGQPLPSATRAYFEPRFGYDFSHVRVHTDDQSAASASS